VLVFAINLPESLRIILVGITISFKNNADVYEKIWERLKLLLKRMGIKTGLFSLISDMGSSELSFISNADNFFKSVFCWFHVLIKAFIPIIYKLHPSLRNVNIILNN
jgi:hypothetical protein